MGSDNGTAAGAARAIHVCVGMFSAVVLILFALSGFMFLHAEMFGIDSADQANVMTPAEKLPVEVADRASRSEVTDHLDEQFGVSGTLERFDVYTLGGDQFGGDAGVIDLTLRTPADSVTVLISRKTGELRMTRRSMNLAALLGNLHRGKSTGEGWRGMINLVAACLLVACVSGIILCLADRRRRVMGLTALIAGLAVWIGAYVFLVLQAA